MDDHHNRSLQQEVWDFREVRNLIIAVDPNSDYLTQLEGWSHALAQWRTSPANWHLAVIDNFAPIVTWVIGFVGALDRPLMLERFQEYARVVLSEEEYAEFVTKPQLIFDFEQLALAANSEALIEEIRILRDRVIAGDRLSQMSDLSPEMRNFYPQFFDTHFDRPCLCARILFYFARIMPGDDALPGWVFFIDDGPDLDAGGIAADLLLPPPTS